MKINLKISVTRLTIFLLVLYESTLKKLIAWLQSEIFVKKRWYTSYFARSG